MIATSTDPLAPFMHALLFRAVPIIVLCGIVGTVLGALKGRAENALTALVRRFVHGAVQKRAAITTHHEAAGGPSCCSGRQSTLSAL